MAETGSFCNFVYPPGGLIAHREGKEAAYLDRGLYIETIGFDSGPCSMSG
jgi:hypothetical protein